MQIDKIKELMHSNDAAEAFFDYLSQRQRNRQDMDIRRVAGAISKKYAVDRQAIGNVYRKMEQLGLGKIVFGSNGKPNRFALEVDIKSIVQAVKSEPLQTNTGIAIKPATDKIVIRKGDLMVELAADIDITKLVDVVAAMRRAG